MLWILSRNSWLLYDITHMSSCVKLSISRSGVTVLGARLPPRLKITTVKDTIPSVSIIGKVVTSAIRKFWLRSCTRPGGTQHHIISLDGIVTIWLIISCPDFKTTKLGRASWGILNATISGNVTQTRLYWESVLLQSSHTIVDPTHEPNTEVISDVPTVSKPRCL